MSTTTADAGRSPLTRLYLTRGVLAVAWAAAFADAYKAHESLSAAAVTLLIAYPLLDAVSSVVDYRLGPDGPERRVTAFNGVLSTLAAIGVGIAGGASGAAAALATFGAWAVLSGAAQVAVGLRRRGPELGKQWPMLIAGGLSFVVGVFYDAQAAGDKPSLSVLSVYATGGGIFFIVQAALLAWKARRGTVQPV
ncbi:integral membrane protein [Catenulispora acidiphila DSM 44928]|uniref:Integral membrane protein n=1 Tax=Catenulispora acidiphila (strain DSM 44928 / JCM 14897 / NBRC 102108 / NRRL B-24433 / ID139908) TaxID=479433 RepID=C7Q6U6_CATAD|nr:hypothetical protein [Catenulispora acidiphila]ACU75959.1 integral membrane protein [Catenulispora acidiphila DSM 44928]